MSPRSRTVCARFAFVPARMPSPMTALPSSEKSGLQAQHLGWPQAQGFLEDDSGPQTGVAVCRYVDPNKGGRAIGHRYRVRWLMHKGPRGNHCPGPWKRPLELRDDVFDACNQGLKRRFRRSLGIFELDEQVIEFGGVHRVVVALNEEQQEWLECRPVPLRSGVLDAQGLVRV